ncbi:MAG: hypothetical protein C0597_05285, partial [Marinilabiliales bacterium]
MNLFIKHFIIGLAFTLVCINPIIADNFDDNIQLNNNDVNVEMTSVIVRGIETEIKLSFRDQEFRKVYEGYPITVKVNDQPVVVRVIKGNASFKYKFSKKEDFEIKISGFTYTKKVNPIPLWFSIIPPLIAILFALIFKEVFTALFIGILVGTATMFWYQDTSLIPAIFKGMFAIVDTYIIEALTESGHMAIIIFSML